MAQTWTPQSWQDKPIRQVPDYPDKAALERVLSRSSRPTRRWCSRARRAI